MIDSAVSTDEVRFERCGAIGLITLDRPKALNALTQSMCLAIDYALASWATNDRIAAVVIQGAGDKAFCAGGDVRAIYDDGLGWKRAQSDGQVVRDFFRDEYRMNRRIKTFPKPYIALIDGITMGGGIGVSVHGSHRVATERTVVAMPETGIGLFPDVGASYMLSRLPGETGIYLALTGARIKSPDVISLGVATHYLSSNRISGIIITALTEADWGANTLSTADALIEHYRSDPGSPPPIMSNRDIIDRCFGYLRVEEILAALAADGSDFAKSAAGIIGAMSPTSLKVTLAEMHRGRALDFDECLKMEYRLTQSILTGFDFYEGIRALLIDKDRNPKWNPATLDAVDDDAVERHFLPPSHGDLAFQN